MVAMAGMISALDIDNVKDYNEKDKVITITNSFGLGSKLAEYKLTYNTDQCLIDCYAEGEATIYESDKLFRDLKFYSRNKEVRHLKKSTILIERKEEYQIEVTDHTKVCRLNGNGTEYCINEETGSHLETRYRNYWEEYNGKKLEAGTYKWRIEGKKDVLQSVDWVGSSYGKEFTEWAWWNANWNKKKKIDITDTAGREIVNYTIPINITYDSDMQADFDDIRFTNESENEELDYIIETFEASDTVMVWVRIPTLLPNTNTSIYMYYDNAGASNGEDSLGTFGADMSFATEEGWTVDGLADIDTGEKKINITNALDNANANYIRQTSNRSFDNFYCKYKIRITSWITGMASRTCMFSNQPDTWDWGSSEYSVGTTFWAGGSGDRTMGISRIDDSGTNEASSGWNADLNTNYTLISFKNDTTVNSTIYSEAGAVLASVQTTMNLPSGTTLDYFSPANHYESATSKSYSGDYFPQMISVRYILPEPSYTVGAEESGNNLEVTLNTPVNYYNTSSLGVTFNCSATDETGVENLTIIYDGVDNSTTNGGAGLNISIQPTDNFADGDHNWTCRASDGSGVGDPVTATTQFFSVDSTLPAVTITEKNFTYSQVLTDNQVLNFTISDSNIDSCWYDYNGTNLSLNCSHTGVYLNLSNTDTNITIYANDTFGNEANDYFNWNITQTTITFNAVNYLDQLIGSVNFTGDFDYLGNPYSDFMSTWLNDSVKYLNMSINITDLTYRNQDENFTQEINYSTTEYNMSLDPNQLVLEFYDSNGTSATTKFELATPSCTSCTSQGVFANDSAQVVVVQQGLPEGIIKVVFNQDDFGANWTQFYEYENDLETHISEELTLLDTDDWVAYFDVKDMGNSPIEEATIRAEYAKTETGNWTNYTLIGQRLTQQDGTTFFWFDSSSFILLTITADGYTPVEKVLRIGDETADEKTLAIPIYLEESETGVENNMWVYLPKYVNNKSSDIKGIILHKTADQVKINTAYRDGLGLEQKELVDDDYGRYYFTLTSGTDFDSSAIGDITVYIYIDGSLVKTWTITEKEITRIFDIPSLDDDVEVVVGAIALIFISGAIGLLFTSATAGFTVFMAGSIFMSLLNLNFLWFSAVGIIYFTLKAIKKVFME